MSVIIVKEQCKGCRKCIKGCPFNAIEMHDKIAVINSMCTSCGACIETCPFSAIVKEEVKINEQVNVHDYKDVWVFAEQREGKLMPVVIELLGEGKKLAQQIGSQICAVLCGEAVEGLVEELFAYGAEKVYVAEHPLLKNYRTDAYTTVIYESIIKFKPEIILLGATHIGRDLGPCLAVKCNTGLTADCTKLEIDPSDKKIMQTRPAFGGNLMATIICPNHRPQMSTVRPGVMDKADFNKGQKGEIIPLLISLKEEDVRTKIIEIVKTATEKVSLVDAEIIISGGLGIGKPEGFELLQQLADKLGGTIASSRACVDAGWINHSYQVGQTGTTVKPKIYFAFGISGAIQHLAGMQESDLIIAVNKNENAPIFEVADYGIVGNLYEIIPAMLDEIDKIRV